MNEDLQALREEYCLDCSYYDVCWLMVPKSGDCQWWQDYKNTRDLYLLD